MKGGFYEDTNLQPVVRLSISFYGSDLQPFFLVCQLQLLFLSPAINRFNFSPVFR